MRKGQSPNMVREVSGWLERIGTELSVYVLLGLGGRDRWQEHARKTARLLGDIRPAFIRIRRLFVFPEASPDAPPCPLGEDISRGLFIEQSEEGTVRELALLINCLPEIPSFFTCDHRNNFIRVAGYVDQDKEQMLAEIRDFLSLPEHMRQKHYAQTGSGI